ncbi:hypothetical protein JX266_001619 [Neoarthrinium moseri]|nr:hypothetical protein JX266_001619 [Neoarthrinium moseri]
MAGTRHRRAASNSTVATVDEQALTYYKETQVIRPAPANVHPNDWPLFLLTEAAVYNRHGQLANLLEADLEGPFMIRGLLAVESDQSKLLMRGHTRSRLVWIEMPRVYSYSFGLKEETGMPVLWAQGECCHLEIVPSERYEPIASTMFQGIVMHYAILDLYLEQVELLKAARPKAKKRKLDVQDVQDAQLPIRDILYGYAAAVGDGSTEEEVTQRCKDQARFLLAQFPKGTGFHAWLGKQFPDIVQRLGKKPDPSAEVTFAEPALPEADPTRQKSSSAERRDAKGKGKAVPSTRGTSNAQSDRTEASSDDQRGSRARSAKSRQKSVPKSVKDESPDQVDIDMQDFARKPVALPARVKNGAQSLDTPAEPQSALSAVIDVLNDEREKALDAFNTGAKQKKHPDSIPHTAWLTKLYLAMSISNYAAKAEIMQYHAGGLAQRLGPEWKDSELYKWAKKNANIKPRYEHITEEQILKIRRRQRMPDASSRDGKSTAASTSQTPETSGKQPRRGRPSGKAAVLRPSLGGSSKRLRDDDDNDEDILAMETDTFPRKKSARTSQYFADGDDDVDSDAVTSLDDDDDEDSGDKEPLARLVVHAEPLPSITPKGPNHTWSCEEPDCEYVVRGANDQDGQELIRRHYEEHEKEASDEAKERELSQVNLAMQESGGHLPINHLLDKIRKATYKKPADQVELNGRVVPQPIKRSLLI